MRIKISFILKIFLLVFFAFLPTACSFIEYKEKPLDINEVHQKNKQSNFNDSDFLSYLKENNFNEINIPFKIKIKKVIPHFLVPRAKLTFTISEIDKSGL